MIILKEVLTIHELLIEKFGGAHGVRDWNALDAAINRPFATFEGIELYPNVIGKASAILESILISHPFIDGNKRIGYVLMRLLLMQEGIEIIASQTEKFDLVIAVAKGEVNFDDIKVWLQIHTIKNS